MKDRTYVFVKERWRWCVRERTGMWVDGMRKRESKKEVEMWCMREREGGSVCVGGMCIFACILTSDYFIFCN